MSYQLMIHGGAGPILSKDEYAKSIETILAAARELLNDGVSALEVVERSVMMLEDDPLFNAGRGSVLNHLGNVEMDAAIMNGSDLGAGSVAAVQLVKNPIALARVVMERSGHVMLIGEGALEFALSEDLPTESREYFLTDKRIAQWKALRLTDKVALDHQEELTNDKKFGTVGAVAMDIHGNLAAATSTGGMTNKKFGRVGDSPIIGAGVFADNQTCAVSCTGTGEAFIRSTLAKRVAEYIQYKDLNAKEATDLSIKYLVQRVGGEGGVIAIDRNGNWGSSFSTTSMIHGRANKHELVVMS